MHSVRFIHTSDFHLDEPLGGLTHVPARLREDFIDAPFVAAEKVFATAVQENVDFVALAGDVVNLETAGPRAIDFLLRQFQVLSENEINVYWVGGQIDDPDLWPPEITLPKNCHLFSTTMTETVEVHKKKRHLATIVGQSFRPAENFRLSDFSISASNVARIAIGYGEFEARSLQRQSIDYWALGGRHNPEVLFENGAVARYSGNPQGMRPAEADTHGCSLVQIEHGRTHVRSIETAAIRWKTERVHLPVDADAKDLEQAIVGRSKSLDSGHSGALTLVTWLVASDGMIVHEIQNEKTCDKILSASQTADGVISVAIEPDFPEFDADQYPEETILGDFLRAIGDFKNDPDRVIELTDFLPDSSVKQDLIASIRISTAEERNRILNRVAALGVRLLDGESAAAGI